MGAAGVGHAVKDKKGFPLPRDTRDTQMAFALLSLSRHAEYEVLGA